MAKVLVSDKLSEAGLDILRNADGINLDYKPGLSEDELASVIGGYDGLVIRSGSKVTSKVLERADALKVIGRAGIGVDNVDVPVASRRGIVVMNTPTGNAVTTAEHAISLLLSLARKIPEATASMKAGKWEKTKFQGREISGKTLGIIGMGNIGRIVADRAQGLKLKVIAFDPVLSSERAAALGVELVPLDELFARADFITTHAPLTPETKGLVGQSAFEKMKNGVLVVNAARGGIVDEDALYDAIKAGKVAGAALDVFVKEPIPTDHKLLGLEEVVLTPHLGASTSEAQERVALEIADQVAEFLTRGTIRNAVNVASLEGDAAKRLRPYQDLAQRLGHMVGQLGAVNVRELRVLCTGEAANAGTRPVANAALAGYLNTHVDQPVNAISAPFEAKERGIAVTEVREEANGRYTSSVVVTVAGEAGVHTATGTIGSGGEPLLVGLDGHELDATLDGSMLVIHNDDRPGVIGAIGTLLGQKGINVSRMQVGLGKDGALALWNVDQAVDDATRKEVESLPNIKSVLQITL